MQKKTILIDLDGVLNTYTGIYEPHTIPPMREGAEDFLKKLSDKYKLILFSSRDLGYVKNWIKEHALEKYFEAITNVKEPAYLIIDDRCVRFDGDFNNTLNAVEDFGVWWKKS